MIDKSKYHQVGKPEISKTPFATMVMTYWYPNENPPYAIENIMDCLAHVGVFDFLERNDEKD